MTDRKLVLPRGARMPALSLGVFRIPSGPTTRRVVDQALGVGYRAIDTAAIYGNEVDVGQAVRDSGLSRDEVFVTTKLPQTVAGRAAARREIEASRRRLGLGPIDLLLVHWPTAEGRRETWDALIEARKEGACRAIGVSNFEARHLDDLGSTGVLPEVDQIEAHPFLPQTKLCASCRTRGIVVSAHSVLTRGARLHDERLGRLATQVGVSPAELLVAWGLAQGTAVTVGSIDRTRMETNLRALHVSLPPEIMQALAELEDGYRVSWDPSDVP